MIEEKFNEFLRSPAGIGLAIGAIVLLGIIVLTVVLRVFASLLAPTPFSID